MADTLPIDSSMLDRWSYQWFKQLGFNNEQLVKRTSKVEQFTRFVLDRLQTKKSADIVKREQLLVEGLREYEHRLNRTGFENDINEEFESLKLKQKEMLIEKKHQELDMKEEKSIRELDQLYQNERILCNLLTATASELMSDDTLIKRIERLRDYVLVLEKIKSERLTAIKSYRSRLRVLCEQLDFQPDASSIVSQLLSENYDSCLTIDALSQIESLLEELDRKAQTQENYVHTLVSTLEKLYAKLAGSDNSSPKRSAAYILRQNTVETVKQLESEIAQLQAQRMVTGKAYCESMRKKIEELYDQCQVGIFERCKIDFEIVTPETIDECDRDYDRMEEMYRARKPVIDAFEQWKVLAEQHVEFQKKSTSAARFHERGYSAVKEQAERKRFAVALPKIERACLTALEQWEKEHVNEQFLLNDVPIRQLIEHQHSGASMTTTTSASATTVASTKTQAAAPTSKTTAVPRRPLAKANVRRKSLRQVAQQASQSRQSEADEDTFSNTLEFTKLENIRHVNGLPRIVTSTPKIGKNTSSSGSTVVDTGRLKTNDPIHKRRPSKRLIPTRR